MSRTSEPIITRQLGAAPSAFRGCGFRLNLTRTTTTTAHRYRRGVRSHPPHQRYPSPNAATHHTFEARRRPHAFHLVVISRIHPAFRNARPPSRENLHRLPSRPGLSRITTNLGTVGASFLNGAPANEAGRDDIEGPQRRVTIPQFFGFAEQSILLAPEILQT